MTAIPENAAQPQDFKKALADFPDTVTIPTSKGNLVLPHFAKIPGGALRKARKHEEKIDQFYTLIEIALGDPSPELDFVDSLNLAEQGEVFQKWSQGAALGESSSSES